MSSVISSYEPGIASEVFSERRAHTPMACYIASSRTMSPSGSHSIKRDSRPTPHSQRQQQPQPSTCIPIRGKLISVSGQGLFSPIRRAATPPQLSTMIDVPSLSRVNISNYSSATKTRSPPSAKGSQSTHNYDQNQMPRWDTTEGTSGDTSQQRVRVPSFRVSPIPHTAEFNTHSPHRHSTPNITCDGPKTPLRNANNTCLNNSCAFDFNSSLSDSLFKIYSSPSSPLLVTREQREEYQSEGGTKRMSTPKSQTFAEVGDVCSPGCIRSTAVLGVRSDMTPHRFRPRSSSGSSSIKFVNGNSSGVNKSSFISSMSSGPTTSSINGCAGNLNSSIIDRYVSPTQPRTTQAILSTTSNSAAPPPSIIRRKDSMHNNTTATTTYTNNNKSIIVMNSAREGLYSPSTTTTAPGNAHAHHHTSASSSPTVPLAVLTNSNSTSSNGMSHSSSSHSDHKLDGNKCLSSKDLSRIGSGVQQPHDCSNMPNVWNSFTKNRNSNAVPMSQHFNSMTSLHAQSPSQQQRDENIISRTSTNMSTQSATQQNISVSDCDGCGEMKAKSSIGDMKSHLNFDNSKGAAIPNDQEKNSSRNIIVRRVEEGSPTIGSLRNRDNHQEEELFSQTYSSHQYQQLQKQRHEKSRQSTRHVADDNNYSLNNSQYPVEFTKPSAVGRATLRHLVHKYDNRHSENPNSYKEGGYMIVTPGTILMHRYVVIHKLGWGEFSTVWLAYDKRAAEQRHTFVAVKISKCHRSVVESSMYEISLLKYLTQKLRRGTPATLLIDSFEHRGEYGTHLCMVMPVCGSNLLSIIDQMKAKRGQKRRDKEMIMLKDITTAILRGIVELEAVNVIHTDLKPENILVAAPDPKVSQVIQSFLKRNAELVKHVDAAVATDEGDPNHLVSIADFGLSVVLEPTNTNNAAARAVGVKRGFSVKVPGIVSNASNGTLIQTREYRAPEILLGCDFNCRSDIWSIGCIVYELITGDFLMDPKRKTRNEREMDVEHLAMMMQLIGPVPSRICNATTRQHNPSPCVSPRRAPRYIHRYFDDSGKFIYADKYQHYPRRDLVSELRAYLDMDEARHAAHFIMSCFSYDPMERPSARELLDHDWLKTA
eukprot:Tbor_TRINITY_DN5044_c0_g1::TRINITY_DN5044_c0_g1_i1::g.14295::m.14295/K08832/SRPK3, STK23; serine/threonine-protein kinase SRPK3